MLLPQIIPIETDVQMRPVVANGVHSFCHCLDQPCVKGAHFGDKICRREFALARHIRPDWQPFHAKVRIIPPDMNAVGLSPKPNCRPGAEVACV